MQGNSGGWVPCRGDTINARVLVGVPYTGGTQIKMSFSETIKRKGNTDEWYTPRHAVEMILPYVKGKVWCPFDTDNSNFPIVFRENNIECENTHISTGKDFFEYEPSEYDCIVSNPPYSKRNEILDRLYSFNKPFAMLLNMNGIFDASFRFELCKSKGVQLFIPHGRTRFIKRDGTTAQPPFLAIYVCHDLLPRQIVFE